MSAGNPTDDAAAAIRRAALGNAVVQITFADGEVVMADELGGPFDNDGSLDFVYRALQSSHAARHEGHGWKPRTSFLARVADVLSVRATKRSDAPTEPRNHA